MLSICYIIFRESKCLKNVGGGVVTGLFYTNGTQLIDLRPPGGHRDTPRALRVHMTSQQVSPPARAWFSFCFFVIVDVMYEIRIPLQQ